ncbi:hypothetical protein Agub_g6808, partial [Astrephomene gubernaculifera]
MAQQQAQDPEELIKQTILRLEQLAPVLRWPRIAYQAKLNPYGSFYATFYDAASNRRVDNTQAGPSATQPGSTSPPPGSSGGDGQQPTAAAAAPGAGSPTPTPTPAAQQPGSGAAPQRQSTSPSQAPQQQQPALPPPQQQQQQQQRKGPRGFNIPRPAVRRPAPLSAVPDQDGATSGPSPTGSQLAHSPGAAAAGAARQQHSPAQRRGGLGRRRGEGDAEEAQQSRGVTDGVADGAAGEGEPTSPPG